MAFTFLSSAAGTSGAHGGGLVGPFDSSGAALVVVSASTYGVGSVPTLTDSKGNTYTALTAYTLGNARHRIFYCLNPIVGPGHFVILNPTSTYSAVCVFAFGGLTIQYDGSVNGATGTTSPLSTGSVTPTVNDALVFTGFCCDETSLAGYPAGFTGGIHLPNSSGLNVQGAAAYQIQTTLAAVNPAWSFTNTHQAAASVAVFKEVANTGAARISQVPIEVAILSDAPNPARVSQLPLEIAVLSDAPLNMRVSQVAVEVMMLAPSTLPAKVSQVAVEVLYLPGPGGGGGVGVGPWMGDSGGSIWVE